MRAHASVEQEKPQEVVRSFQSQNGKSSFGSLVANSEEKTTPQESKMETTEADLLEEESEDLDMDEAPPLTKQAVQHIPAQVVVPISMPPSVEPLPAKNSSTLPKETPQPSEVPKKPVKIVLFSFWEITSFAAANFDTSDCCTSRNRR